MTELVIEAGRAERNYWSDLWRYRELLYFLAWRDILVRYKQTAIGIAWALIRPLVTMVVFTIVFGRLAGLPSEGVPYPVLVLAAIVPWQFFANAFAEAGGSLVGNANLISKIYFPRLIVPASAVVANVVDLALSAGILALLLIWYGVVPGWQLITLPVFVFIALFAAFGGGLWIAALNVTYRDFRYVLPFIVQIGLYISPVGFSSTIVAEEWRLLYSLNPMVSVIDGFRWAVTGGKTALYWPGVALSCVVVMLVFAGGLRHFRQTERTFADLI
jgi:lipopolysaccharide transport system permease protein